MKPIKFDLPLNGTRVGTLEQLKNNLSAEVLEPFRSGRLAKWLHVRNLTEQVEAIEALLAADTEHEEKLLKSLYELFGGEISDDWIRAAIAERKKSLPLSQESCDMEIEAVKAAFAKKEIEYQQEIEQLKNPPKTKVIETHIGQFIVHDDGTALDTQTGLTWCRFSYGETWQNGAISGNEITLSWDNACDIAKQFNQQGGYAGHTDWRLPKVEELSTLANKMDDSNSAVFFHRRRYFWSSSPYDGYCAWRVEFSKNGIGCYENNCKYAHSKKNEHAVRLVRS